MAQDRRRGNGRDADRGARLAGPGAVAAHDDVAPGSGPHRGDAALFVIQELASVRRKARAVLLAATGGGVVSAMTTLTLSAWDLLRGPTLRGPDGATDEALLLTGRDHVGPVLLGLLLATRSGKGRAGRRPTTHSPGASDASTP